MKRPEEALRELANRTGVDDLKALVAMLILAGYFGLKDYYFIWLGVVGGCALIAGGLWLRTA